MSAKKVPLRMCIGCREMKPKQELYRVVKCSDGNILIDKTNKISGRGAYICKCGACLEKAHKSNALSRAFEMSIDSEIYSQLAKECEQFE